MTDAGPFPPTRHSIVEALQGPAGGDHDLAFDRLVEGYWRPVYKYLRRRWQREEAAAEDLTQAFFAHLLEKRALAGFDPAKGRFRTFLRVCLDRFASNEHKAAHRQKRAGAHRHLALDFTSAEGELVELPLVAEDDADRFFREEWVRSLFGLAVEALREDCASGGRTLQWRLFEAYDLAEEDDRPTYEALAARFEVPVTKVTNDLHAVRKRFRRHLLETLSQLCASEQESREEARETLGIELP